MLDHHQQQQLINPRKKGDINQMKRRTFTRALPVSRDAMVLQLEKKSRHSKFSEGQKELFTRFGPFPVCKDIRDERVQFKILDEPFDESL